MLDHKFFRGMDGADLGNAAHIISSEVQQHQVLGQFLLITQKVRFQCTVLVRGRATLSRSCDWSDCHFFIEDAYKDLGTCADDLEAAAQYYVSTQRPT